MSKNHPLFKLDDQPVVVNTEPIPITESGQIEIGSPEAKAVIHNDKLAEQWSAELDDLLDELPLLESNLEDAKSDVYHIEDQIRGIKARINKIKSQS